jgi:hypothetical protein
MPSAPSADAHERRDVWAAVGKACLGAVVLTLGTVFVGWFLFSLTLPPSNGDSDAGPGLAFVAWAIVVPISLGPVYLWALVTYGWRRLRGPRRAVRVLVSLPLLLPSLLVPFGMVELFWGFPDDPTRSVVVGSVLLAVAVGTLLTGRVLSTQHTAIAISVVILAGTAGVVYSSSTVDTRREARIRRELEELSLPLAVPRTDSRWIIAHWEIHEARRPRDAPGGALRTIAALDLVNDDGARVTLEMWGEPADWYCARAACRRTAQTVDGVPLQVQQDPQNVAWVMAQDDRTWVITNADGDTIVTVTDALSSLESVDATQWAAAVAPLDRP